MKTLSFSDPYASEQADIERRLRLAQALQAQGAEGLGPTEMVGGFAVKKSPFEGLAKVAQQGLGAYQERQAGDMAKALRERQQGDTQSDMSAYVNALRGQEARPEIPQPAPELGGGPGAPAQAAVPAGRLDPSVIGQMRTPQMQQLAMGQWQQQMARDAAPPERVDLGDRIGLVKNGVLVGSIPKGVTPDATFKEGGLNLRHAKPSGGAILGAQTTVRGQDMTDARTRSEGAANRGVTLQGQALVDARARDAAQAGRIPPGYRTTADGGLEATPGGPADEKEAKKQGEIKKTLDMYVAARDGLLTGLEGTTAGPILGRIPAVTTGQQVAAGGVSAMSPVLKQIFRVAGEGTFTDRDQALLLEMVPTRADRPEARAEKIANIDRIISAKLGAPVPERVLPDAAPKRISGDKDYDMLPKGARYIGPDGVERTK